MTMKRKATTDSTSTTPLEDRSDPNIRGIHQDGIQASISPSSRAECIDCGKSIMKGSVRWGIKYAGNPLTGIAAGVIPLYGTHPMVMWCHGTGGCGLRYQQQQHTIKDNIVSNNRCEAARTCHLCSNTPDAEDGDCLATAGAKSYRNHLVKLLCGGQPRGKKIRQHAFHIKCWRDAIQRSSTLNDEAKRSILDIDPTEVTGWDSLTDDEQKFVRKWWNI